MKAKVPKCHSLALQASTAKSFNPKLTLYEQPIHFIGTKAIRFLHGFYHSSASELHTTKSQLALKLVDKVPVTTRQKLLLYRAVICPRLNWVFMVNDLPISWITSTLEAEATQFLKRWVKLARPADPSRLYLPTSKGGLALPSISALYQKQRASLACQILTSTDPTVRHTATLGISREEELSRPKFKPMTVVRDTWQKDPSANRKALTRRTKVTIMHREDCSMLEG